MHIYIYTCRYLMLGIFMYACMSGYVDVGLRASNKSGRPFADILSQGLRALELPQRRAIQTEEVMSNPKPFTLSP